MGLLLLRGGHRRPRRIYVTDDPASARLILWKKATTYFLNPSRSGEALPQGGHDHPIARAPAHALDLALKNLHLAAEREHLSLKLGLIAATHRNRVHEDAH